MVEGYGVFSLSLLINVSKVSIVPMVPTKGTTGTIGTLLLTFYHLLIPSLSPLLNPVRIGFIPKNEIYFSTF